MGTAPTLGTVRCQYGEGVAKTWLLAQIADLSEFAGCRDKIGEGQVRQLVEIIMSTYGHFKISEIMLFFLHFKQGHYGKFYGSVDPMVIMSALRDFADERWENITRYENERERQERESERKVWDEMRADYSANVPGAYTPDAIMSFIEYMRDYVKMDPEERGKNIRSLLSVRIVSEVLEIVVIFAEVMDMAAESVIVSAMRAMGSNPN